jgi:three-Cys-motif partner protein
MTSKSFFEEPREWSARKHRILTAYLKPFCQALSGQVPKGGNGYIYYVDCFAGAGTYRLQDGSKIDGSPVLAAQVAQSLPYPIKCINVESEPQHYASLVRVTEPYKDLVINIQGSINSHINNILLQIRDDPAFFFLDPFGIIDIPITGLVDVIAQRRAITDILIRYDPTIVRRLCGRAFQDPKRGLADAANLDRIFAGGEWRKIAEEAPDSTELDYRLLSLYASSLIHMNGSRLKFVATYRLRTLEDKLKYFVTTQEGLPALLQSGHDSRRTHRLSGSRERSPA